MTRPARLTRKRAGFTFVEVMVVLLLIAAMAGLSVMALGSLDGSKVRAETIRMSGAIRFVYGRSAINGIRYQLVINLDDDSYRVECSEDNAFIAADDTGGDGSLRRGRRRGGSVRDRRAGAHDGRLQRRAA